MEFRDDSYHMKISTDMHLRKDMVDIMCFTTRSGLSVSTTVQYHRLTKSVFASRVHMYNIFYEHSTNICMYINVCVCLQEDDWSGTMATVHR